MRDNWAPLHTHLQVQARTRSSGLQRSPWRDLTPINKSAHRPVEPASQSTGLRIAYTTSIGGQYATGAVPTCGAAHFEATDGPLWDHFQDRLRATFRIHSALAFAFAFGFALAFAFFQSASKFRMQRHPPFHPPFRRRRVYRTESAPAAWRSDFVSGCSAVTSLNWKPGNGCY